MFNSIKAIAGAVAAVVISSAASAAVIPLGTSGWTAVTPAHLDGTLNLSIIEETDDTLSIGVSTAFSTIDVGIVDPQQIVLIQTDIEAVSQVILADVMLDNLTGASLPGMTLRLFGGADYGEGKPAFDPDSLGNASISPYTNAFLAQDNRVLVLGGGVISGPAQDAETGEGVAFFSKPNPQGTGQTFTVKLVPGLEPPIPEPGIAGGLIGLGLMALRRRRSA